MAPPSDRIRVLRVIARLNVGGPALHVAYLSKGLVERGYDTTLVAGDVAKGEESMAFVAEQEGVQIVRLAGLSREIAPIRDLVAAFRLAGQIRRMRPDVLHTHTAKAGAVGRLGAVLAGRARPRLVVHTYHGHVLRGYFGPVGTRVFNVVERTLARVTDVLVAVSPQVRDDLVKIGIASQDRFEVIRLGIDLDSRVANPGDRNEERRQLGIGPERFVIGWVGRMTAVKQTDDLIDVLVAVRDGGTDACLLLVGDGNERESLELRAKERGVARHVLFLGYQKHVANWYSVADAVVLTSLNEGTPVTIIEALAAERPVVATDVGGVADVVRDGIDGFLVPAGDTTAMAAKLVEIAADPALAGRMASEGRKRVLERYAVERLVNDIDALYTSRLGTRAPIKSR
jgi:glycosyltransferase involved in cell wall biosynthesis